MVGSLSANAFLSLRWMAFLKDMLQQELIQITTKPGDLEFYFVFKSSLKYFTIHPKPPWEK